MIKRTFIYLILLFIISACTKEESLEKGKNYTVDDIGLGIDTPSEEIQQTAEEGKLLGFPFPLGTPYTDIINKLGQPDKEGIFGEGSYNLIYGNFNLAFNYLDLNYAETRNLDTEMLKIYYDVTNDIKFSYIEGKLGELKNQYTDEYGGYTFSQYNMGEYALTVQTQINDTFDIKDDRVTRLELSELPARFNFQMTGTDGESYDVKLYSENEEARQITLDDSWYSHLEGYPMYSGKYTALVKLNGHETNKKRLGSHTFVLEDETSTTTVIPTNKGYDVLIITQKDSSSYTRYNVYIVKNGKLTRISFQYKGEPMDSYFEGFRYNLNNTWQSLSFSNASNYPWLVLLWELDEQSEVFRHVDTLEYETKPPW